MSDDYELLASVLRKFKAGGYFHLWHEEPWTDDEEAGGGWRFTIDTGIDLTDEEAEAVQRVLLIDGSEDRGLQEESDAAWEGLDSDEQEEVRRSGLTGRDRDQLVINKRRRHLDSPESGA